MISKELFSIVLGEEVKSFDPTPIVDTEPNDCFLAMQWVLDRQKLLEGC